MGGQSINTGVSNASAYIHEKMYFSGVGTDEFTIPVGLWRFIPIYSKSTAGTTIKIENNGGLPILTLTGGASYTYFYQRLYDWDDGLGFYYIPSDGIHANINITGALASFEFILIRVG